MAYIFSYTAGVSTVSTCNLQPSTYGEVFFHMKELLKAAGWSVVRSGDGLSAFSGTTDVLTGSGSGANGCNNPGAWFVAQMPSVAGATRQLLVFMGSTTTIMNRGGMRFVYSCSGAFTGGAANTRPNATDGFALSTLLSNIYTTSLSFTTNTDGGSYLNTFGVYTADNDASLATNLDFSIGADDGTTAGAKYGFYVIAHTKGAGLRAGAVYIDPLSSYDSLDADPFVLYCSTQADARPQLLGYAMSGVSYNLNVFMAPRAIYKKGTVDQLPIACPALLPYINGTQAAANFSINPYSGKDELIPVFYGRSTQFSTQRGFKGTSSLLRMVLQTRNTGDTYSVQSTRDRIVYGEVALPWNGSVPVV